MKPLSERNLLTVAMRKADDDSPTGTSPITDGHAARMVAMAMLLSYEAAAGVPEVNPELLVSVVVANDVFIQPEDLDAGLWTVEVPEGLLRESEAEGSMTYPLGPVFVDIEWP